MADALVPAARKLIDSMLRSPSEGRSVAFDADGTLWRGDVGEDLLRFLCANGRLPKHFGRSGLYEEYEAKVAVDPASGYAFAVQVMEELEEAQLERWSREFFRARFEGRVFAYVRPLLAELRANDFPVWVVSASPRWIVEAGAECLGLGRERVIGVDCELDGGKLTARVKQPLPCGDGKVAQLRARGVRLALALGNGELDVPMLESAERAIAVAPYGEETAVARLAAARGWPVQRG